MASSVKRATQTDGPQCGDVWPTEKEEECKKERKMESGPPECHPGSVCPPSSLSSSLAEDRHSAQASDKDFQCAFWRKKSVSQQQLGSFAVDTLCVRVCACVQEVGVQTTHRQK